MGQVTQTQGKLYGASKRPRVKQYGASNADPGKTVRGK